MNHSPLVRAVIGAWRAFGEDDCLLMAAGLAYYAFLALFPLCLLSIALLGYAWTEPQAVRYAVEQAGELLPPNGVALLRDSVITIAADRQRLGLLGLAALIWLGRMLFEALEISLNRLWRVTHRPRVLRRMLASLGMVVLTSGLIVVESLLSAALAWMQSFVGRFTLPAWFPRPPIDSVLVWNLLHSWGVVPLTVFLFCFTLYQRPPRGGPPARAMWGALFSTLAWKLSSVLYFAYLSTLARSSPVYGSIWGIVGLLIWFYICSAVFLFGAQLIVVRDRSLPSESPALQQ